MAKVSVLVSRPEDPGLGLGLETEESLDINTGKKYLILQPPRSLLVCWW